jgi:hypothetical protein
VLQYSADTRISSLRGGAFEPNNGATAICPAATTNWSLTTTCVNGDVDIEKLNGLDIRLQSILFLRDVLLDGPAADLSESMAFEWRRNSQKEPTGRLNAKGEQIKAFFLRVPPWTINVPLDKKRP